MMRFAFYEHRPCKNDPAMMVLTRTSEPSDKAAFVISPLDPNSDGGHAAIDDFCEKNAAYGDLTRLLGDKPVKALEVSSRELDCGFSDLQQKMAAMKEELELVKAVKEDIF
ncbi:MAG: hypothetical protein L6R38_004668 [Xanthoria sp. 2 TBL-2021]|nr:MAG: hypothetical protein L6R38_004668 [Xanthoria sp. 2 TBL-2021]